MLTDFWEPAWRRALAIITETSGAEAAREIEALTEPVPRARRALEMAAPGTVRVLIALALGTEPSVLEADKGGYRLIAETARAQLAMIGVRAGEGVEVDVSDRMRDFLSRFFQKETRHDDDHPDPDDVH